MDLTGITSTASTSAAIAQADTSETVISSDFETFLKMLTVQMENQDPLDPTDSADYAMQLATFSGVEQQVLTNDLITSLASQLNTSGLSQMADWVGKDARAAMPAYFSGTPITVAPNVAATADAAQLVVYDATGTEVSRNDIALSSDTVEWAGTTATGTPLASGLYSFAVVSSSNGVVISEQGAEVYASVREVRRENGQLNLLMDGDVSVYASDVSALRE